MVKKNSFARNTISTFSCSLIQLLMLFTLVSIPLSHANAQTYPPTIWIHVTYFDFHSNLSNPEFETVPSANPALWINMVDSALIIGTDGKPKPVLGTHPFFNLDIKKWFEKWVPGDSLIPNYGTPEYPLANAAGLTPKFISASTDTAFKNMVIEDSLPFTYVANSAGEYQYVNNSFFPLDGRGFGNEGLNHNFSYTMELNTKIQMTAGLSFSFSGDDDVWAFVNNKLVMDLGGRHQAQNGTINVDAIAGLTAGKKYNFDFFYCERHTSSATIKITTNLFTPPAFVKIYSVTPPNYSDTTHSIASLDTATAGTPFNLVAHLFDSTGTMRPEYDNNITWTVVPDSLGTLTKLLGDSTTLLANKAYGTVTLTATFKNPSDPNSPTVVKTVKVFIGPGKPHHLDIIRTPVVNNVRVDDPLDTVILDEKTNSTNVYAIIRDSLGNFVDSAKVAIWSISNSSIGTVVSAAGANHWHGIITKVKAGLDTITVSSPGLISATLRVTFLVKNIINAIISGPAHNPTGPNNPLTNAPILSFYENVLKNSGSNTKIVTGSLIGIISKKPLQTISGGSTGAKKYGKAVAYDALGNLVAKDLYIYGKDETMIMSKDSTYSYGIFWDCHNQDHRWVGSGTYLLVGSITDIDGLTKSIKEKIGFNR